MRKKILRHQDNHSVNFSFPPPFWSEDKNKANQSIKQQQQIKKKKKNHQTPKIVETRKKGKENQASIDVLKIYLIGCFLFHLKANYPNSRKIPNLHRFLLSSFIICPLRHKDSRSRISSPSVDQS